MSSFSNYSPGSSDIEESQNIYVWDTGSQHDECHECHRAQNGVCDTHLQSSPCPPRPSATLASIGIARNFEKGGILDSQITSQQFVDGLYNPPDTQEQLKSVNESSQATVVVSPHTPSTQNVKKRPRSHSSLSDMDDFTQLQLKVSALEAEMARLREQLQKALGELSDNKAEMANWKHYVAASQKLLSYISS
ncbi:hypothetical protein CVT26_008928 [Gymnopilus dilepis]|uniref:Uncharacterized protein n=1 Tax=Gymnopilus dilepis TaxID=231916 RepID=A0A409WUU7_9AGAR|nr:hypothetical protein CVT26_008928 [Gymnopilus dilepis]